MATTEIRWGQPSAELFSEPMPTLVAIVEDDRDQRRALESVLRTKGFTVDAYPDRDAASRAFRSGRIPEISILDVNLDGDDPEDRDGFELCREMSVIPRTAQVPVIFLSRLEDHRDHLQGVGLAVAWVQKPPDPEILVGQIHGLLGWSQRLNVGPANGPSSFEEGALRVDIGASRAYWRGSDLELSYCEFEILRCLSNNPGMVKTYQALCDAIGADVTNNTIATHVGNIRNKFHRIDPDFPRLKAIRAVPRRGYMWEPPTDDA